MTEYIATYIKEINQQYRTGLTTEHSFRPALHQLLEACTGCTVVNEQSHIDCGAPDLTLLSKQLPIAYVEAKDLEDGDLDGNKKNKEQFTRYKEALDTIVFTDYLDFHLYERGELTMHVRLAEIVGNKVYLQEEAIDMFVVLMNKLREAKPQRITSASRLAKLMAHRARMLAKAIEKSLMEDVNKDNKWWYQLRSFKDTLISDITEKKFADLYAQTIAYGLFAARLHDTKPTNFSREEAAKLVPHSNPFLREFFQYIAGNDIDTSIEWIVNDLVSVFAAVDVTKLRRNFEREFARRDPMIHFYEDFLFQYDPATKKQCGVYYTPQPVVEFIVRAVDDILKNVFGLLEGLADTSKSENGNHRVQVLDPATGTGTFLAEVINRIKETQQEGMWPSYVEEHLIPRIYGFELMMAPYTITHLKLDMLLSWAEGKAIEHENRLKVYLTNSLEQKELEDKHLFAEMIAREANEANRIKHNAPVMVVLGNPPYSVSSNNKSDFIQKLLEDYKKNLNEKKLNLDDDYIKFIRLAQHYVERNGEGVVAYISNNSFIDGLIHRQMRSELMRVFDKIYILNLHGNARQKETCPDGSKDENVFDIMQGVSINIFVKTTKDSVPADVYHYDLFGTRESKYSFLQEHDLRSVEWQKLNPQNPSLFFVPKDFSLQEDYDKGFKVDELMNMSSSGVETQNDSIAIQFSIPELEVVKNDFLVLPELDFRKKYNLVKDGRDWTYLRALEDVKHSARIETIVYRPFDLRKILFSGKPKGITAYPRYEIMRNLLECRGNIAMLVKRGFPYQDRPQGFVTDSLSDRRAWSSSGMQGAESVFPLFLYPEDGSIDTKRVPNLNPQIVEQIAERIKFLYVEEDGILVEPAPPYEGYFRPVDLFDYIYGVLHSPAYCEKYKEFLKVDFPRIPYPKNGEEFNHYRFYGEQLRELHLMHDVPKPTIVFNVRGSDMVEQVKWVDNKVFINETQCFENVPETAWNFYIGGYQPAQKWLKDRKGRKLSLEEMKHYEKIISILLETDRLMQEIDN